MENQTNADWKTEKVSFWRKWKGVKRVWPFSFLLLPAILFLIYDTLLWFGIIPSRFKMADGSVLDLFAASESVVMVLLSILAFVLLPLAFLLIMAYTYVRRLQDAYAALPEKSARKAAKAARKRAKAEAAEAVAEDANLPVADTEEASSEAVVVSTKAKEGIATEHFAYRKLLEMDADPRRSYAEDCKKSFTLDALAKGFVAFAQTRGLSVPASVSRTLFAAMGASRVVLTVDKKAEVTAKLVSVLAEYLGVEAHVSGAESAKESSDAMLPMVDGARRESEFLCDVYRANFSVDAMCICALDGVERKSAEDALADLLRYSGSVSRRTVLPMPIAQGEKPRYLQDGYMAMPRNLWMILRVRSVEKDAMPTMAMAVDLSAVTVGGASGSEARMGMISYTRFAELVFSAKNEKYIPEEYWKKLDGLEAYVAKKLDYALDNKTVRRMEAFAAVYLSCGGALDGLLDYLVSTVMLPALSRCPKELLTGEADGLATALDRLFGLERMPLCCECMKRMGVH